jgi:metallo-beta-lactamase family protein
LDSPLANRATELFKHHTELFDKEAAAEFSDPFDVQYLEYALTPQDSQKLNNYSKPCVIIA